MFFSFLDSSLSAKITNITLHHLQIGKKNRHVETCREDTDAGKRQEVFGSGSKRNGSWNANLLILKQWVVVVKKSK